MEIESGQLNRSLPARRPDSGEENVGTNGDAVPLRKEEAFSALPSPAAKDSRSVIRFDDKGKIMFKKIRDIKELSGLGSYLLEEAKNGHLEPSKIVGLVPY